MHLDATTLARFWSNVDRSGGPDACWLWLASKRGGYGVTGLNGKQHYTHRLAWQIAHGEVPEGLFVLHSCDVRNCVNVAHLWLGTHEQNMADMVAKGRQALGARNARHTHPETTARGARNGTHTHPERVLRGGHVAQAKLTDEQVREIFRRAHAGEKCAQLAREFGVSWGAVGHIKHRLTWGHVTAPLLEQLLAEFKKCH